MVEGKLLVVAVLLVVVVVVQLLLPLPPGTTHRFRTRPEKGLTSRIESSSSNAKSG